MYREALIFINIAEKDNQKRFSSQMYFRYKIIYRFIIEVIN